MPVRLESQYEPIPGYRLIERLGRGGFGEVWKAEAPGGLLKAIKFVYGDLDSQGDGGNQAEQELKALSRVKGVRHPYILSLDRYDIVDGQLLIVMELADRNLADRLHECRTQGLPGVPREELMSYLEEAAEALDLMNNQYQLQHLDIKPQNLFLVFNHVKVADFGLVKVLEGKGASLTWGVTPAYAAPETFDGRVSRYCDQYSLAIVYQELLTTQRPFNGANARQLLLQHMTKEPDLSPLPDADREAIGRALSKRPEERFPTCAELVRALRMRPVPQPILEPDLQAASAPPAQGERHMPTTEVHPIQPAPDPEPVLTVAIKRDAGAARITDLEIVLPEADASASPGMPPEVKGTGVLFPALVIGLGRLALQTMQRLRQGLCERFGSLAAVPHLGMLYIDTDPEGIEAAGQGEQGVAFRDQEVFLARLHRPSHYLKSDEGKAFVQSWLDPQMLYRIPRLPGTAGLRALGRLAFGDNYRLLAERIRSELAGCIQPEALEHAVRETGLGQHSSRPRVYVVANLGSGTGSGMFLDLAYLVRTLLKQGGCETPDLAGLFFIPTAEGSAPPVLPLGNTVAALTELNHFSSPEVMFQAKYNKETTLADKDAPFQRCLLVPLPSTIDEDAARRVSSLAGGFLYRELVTPLGHTAETERIRNSAPTSRGVTCQTFGVQRLLWPRKTMIGKAAGLLERRLLQSWIGRDAGAVGESVTAWVAEQWIEREFGPEHLIPRFQEACREALGEAPEDAFASIAEPLGGTGKPAPPVDAAAAVRAWEQLEKLVGRAHEDPEKVRGSVLSGAMTRAVEDISRAWEKKLAKVAVALIERPHYRFAGAEKAIHDLSTTIQLALQTHEVLSQELSAKAVAAGSAIQSLLDTVKKSPAWTAGKATAPPHVVEMLRQYAKTRYQSLVLERVCTTYRSLLGRTPEFLVEIGFCRDRLADMLHRLEKAPVKESPEIDLGPGRQLLPNGLKNLDEAVKKLVAGVTPAELEKIDEQVQEVVQRQFKALVRVCTEFRHLGKDFQEVVHRQLEKFVEKKLGGTSAVDVFLGTFANPQAAVEEVRRLATQSAPPLGKGPSQPGPFTIVAIPEKREDERLQVLTRQVLPEVKVIAADRANEIVFYREQCGLLLADLPQTGPAAREAYRQLVSLDHFTPHSRTDITAWLPLPVKE